MFPSFLGFVTPIFGGAQDLDLNFYRAPGCFSFPKDQRLDLPMVSGEWSCVWRRGVLGQDTLGFKKTTIHKTLEVEPTIKSTFPWRLKWKTLRKTWGFWDFEGIQIQSFTQDPLCQTIQSFTTWWLNQPIWKICSSNWIISPNIRGENKKSLSCHHPGFTLFLSSFAWPSTISSRGLTALALNVVWVSHWRILLNLTRGKWPHGIAVCRQRLGA